MFILLLLGYIEESIENKRRTGQKITETIILPPANDIDIADINKNVDITEIIQNETPEPLKNCTEETSNSSTAETPSHTTVYNIKYCNIKIINPQ